MDLGPHVVCFSYDAFLLESRREVIATHFQATSVTSLEALLQCISTEHVELLLICHTVPEEDCLAALAMVRNGPNAIETVLLISNQVPTYAPEQTIMAYEGPLQMLNKLSGILNVTRFLTDHKEGDVTRLFLSHPAFSLGEEPCTEAQPSRRRRCRLRT